MNYTYLIINLALLFTSLVLLLNKKNNPAGNWKFIVPASLISGFFLAVLSWLFTWLNVWSFNAQYLLGVNFGKLPVEALLFCFILPLSSLCVYSGLNVVFPKNDLQKFSLSVSNLVLGVCVAMLFFNYTKWYSAVTFSILLLLLLYIEYINKLRFMYRFYRTYAVLLLIYIFFEALSGIALVNYSSAEKMSLKLGTTPFENYFYLMATLLSSVYWFELLRSKARN